MRLRICRCTRRQLPTFRRLLLGYFRRDLGLPLTAAQADELAWDIWREGRLGVPLCLAWWRGQAVGFIDFQLDKPGGSWCFHPGWGCIRECYLLPAWRGRGLGRALAAHAERWMRAKGARSVYLTADTAIPFWQALGYVCTGRYNPKNQLEELEKPLKNARPFW